MRTLFTFAALVALVVLLSAEPTTKSEEPRIEPQQAKKGKAPKKDRLPPLLPDYVKFAVTPPPLELNLDPFYKKYVNAGIPIVSSEEVPDAALLVVRDIVVFMLSDRPDLRKELIRMNWKVAVMAETEVTYDIPEHRKFRVLPKIDDERLTAQQKANYNKPGGVGSMTGEAYWNMRGRGFGGEPDGENTTSCAEENLLGYPGTKYYGQNILVHEFSHGIMRGAVYGVDKGYKKAVVDAYEDAKKKNLRTAVGYYGNNFNEYWAGGIEIYTSAGGGPQVKGRQGLKDVDPVLYDLVTEVIPEHKMPGNIYYGKKK